MQTPKINVLRSNQIAHTVSTIYIILKETWHPDNVQRRQYTLQYNTS